MTHIFLHDNYCYYKQHYFFDNQQYNDQKGTDGPKTLFDSGYSYYPILYYTGSDSKLYFQ